MPVPMSRAERSSLPRLNIQVNPTDRISLDRPGENPTRKIDKYLEEEAVSIEGDVRTARTDLAARFILEAASIADGVAPYAFTLPNGDPSSLDWWVVSVLKNRGELSLLIGPDGYVAGVAPTNALRKRYGAPLKSAADVLVHDIETIGEDAELTPTERLAQILCRIGQGPFRRGLMDRFGGRCAVTGCDRPEMLRASHIVAWAKDAGLRRNLDNGLLLCAQIDAAFDAHLISFKDDGAMIFSRRFPEETAKVFGVHGKIETPLNAQTRSHLARHRVRLAELDGPD